ncbi:MAG: retron St85 family effector protein [Planctomycetota bacterium]|nr:retron St85 family effector protein [Planctomycetota bacterium]
MALGEGVGARPFLPPALVDLLRKCLRASGTMLRNDSLVVFVCGAKHEDGVSSGRQELVRYARRHLSQFSFFEAEEAFRALMGRTSQDLLSLEDRFAGFSDCILVVVESPGSIAELGAFAIKDELARIMLVVNDKRYEHDPSFISDGPIKKLNRKSRFKPVIHTNIAGILAIGPQVASRLKLIEPRYRKRVRLGKVEQFRQCREKHRMLFLCDLIGLFCPITFKELLGVLKDLYRARRLQIHIELGMLKALDMVYEADGYLMRTVDARGFFYDFEDLDLAVLRAQVVRHIHRFHRDRSRMLISRSLGDYDV